MSQQLTKLLNDGLKLYYRILKLHRRTLPPQMQILGDHYVRQQFKHHHQNAQLDYYLKFYVKWQDYHHQLHQQGVMKVAKNISEKEENMLNSDQKQALKKLKEGIQKNV